MSWKIPESEIDEIIAKSDEKVWEPFHSITVMAWCLPNGYTITEQSGCVDPSEYSRELGEMYCRAALKRKVWQLYGFLAKQRFSDASKDGNDA